MLGSGSLAIRAALLLNLEKAGSPLMFPAVEDAALFISFNWTNCQKVEISLYIVHVRVDDLLDLCCRPNARRSN